MLIKIKAFVYIETTFNQFLDFKIIGIDTYYDIWGDKIYFSDFRVPMVGTW